MSRPFFSKYADPPYSPRGGVSKDPEAARTCLVTCQVVIHQYDIPTAVAVHVRHTDARAVVHVLRFQRVVELLEGPVLPLEEDAQPVRVVVGEHHVVEAVAVQVADSDGVRGDGLA